MPKHRHQPARHCYQPPPASSPSAKGPQRPNQRRGTWITWSDKSDVARSCFGPLGPLGSLWTTPIQCPAPAPSVRRPGEPRALPETPEDLIHGWERCLSNVKRAGTQQCEILSTSTKPSASVGAANTKPPAARGAEDGRSGHHADKGAVHLVHAQKHQQPAIHCYQPPGLTIVRT